MSYKVVEIDRTREFDVKWQASQFVKSFRALAGDKFDSSRLREAAVVFASSAEIPGNEVRIFVDAVVAFRVVDVSEAST